MSVPWCRWVRDKSVPGGKYFLPMCMGGAVHTGYDDIDDPLDFCTCYRPPKYKRGQKARLERLYARKRMIERRICEMDIEIYGMSFT